MSWYVRGEDNYEERWLSTAGKNQGKVRDVSFVSPARSVVLLVEGSMAFKDAPTLKLLGWESGEEDSSTSSGGSGLSSLEGGGGGGGGGAEFEFRKRYFNSMHVRKKFLLRQLNRILCLRRAQVITPLVWSSFPAPTVLFTALPTILLPLPPPRPSRLVLFPTFNPEPFSWDDVKGWYSDVDLEVDDEKMRQAEKSQQLLTVFNLVRRRRRRR